jgi:NAD(P)-dependent dehydrogenase (short-subunit alcohol dehydrogenase family)
VTRQRITRAQQLVVRPPRILSRTGGRLREPSHFTKVSRRATGATSVKEGNEEAYAEMEKNIPIGRAGRPEEIASAVLWFCSPGASYVVGHALTVDGGMTVL